MDLDKIKDEFARDWRSEAFRWFRRYLVCRKKYRNVLKQNRYLRKILYNHFRDGLRK